MKSCRVLLLTHPDLVPPDSLKGASEQDINTWKTEYDVVSTLRGCGHEVMPLGVKDELAPIRDAVESSIYERRAPEPRIPLVSYGLGAPDIAERAEELLDGFGR